MRPRKPYLFTVIVLAFTCRAFSQPDSPPASNREANWRDDIRFISSEMQRIHPDLFHTMSKTDFENRVRQLERRISDLSDNQVVLEIMQLIACVSSRRDGHSGCRLFHGTGFRTYPLVVHYFSDGPFAIAANDSLTHLVGSKLKSIEGVSAETTFEAVKPHITADNDMTVLARAPYFMMCPEVLHTLGIIKGTEQIEAVFTDTSGNEIRAKLNPIKAQPFLDEVDRQSPPANAPLYRQRPDEAYWFEFLADFRAVYMKFKDVVNRKDENLARFTDRLIEFIESKKANCLIIDVRLNGGGDNYLNRHLVRAIAACKRVNRPGHLYVITGRETFSAAMNFVTDMERQTEALFAGEPPGGSPNMYGDAVEIIVPHSGLVVRCSSRYWEKSTPDDPRLLHEPDLPVPVSSADYFQGRDPVLEAVLNACGKP